MAQGGMALHNDNARTVARQTAIDVAGSLFAVIIALSLAMVVHPWLGLANLAFLFLVPVIVMAGRRGIWPGLLTATFATLSFNFFLVPPAYTLRVADLDNVVTLGVFALAAIFVSQFASRLKQQASRAEQLAADSDALALLAQELATNSDGEALLNILKARLENWTGCAVRLIDGNSEALDKAGLSPMDNAAAEWSIAHFVPAGRGSSVMAGADALYLPMPVGTEKSYVVQFWHGDGGTPVSPARLGFVKQVITLGGDALHRQLVNQQQYALVARQHQDAMRDALLATISHDLRTPLTTILVGLSALRPDKEGTLDAVRAEAKRLDHMVGNLLELARLQADALPGTIEPVDLTDVIDAAVCAMEKSLSEHRLNIAIAADLPLVRSDGRMLHHMVINLIDNACKYSPAETAIHITAHMEGDEVALSVADQGRGLTGELADMVAVFRRGQNIGQVTGNGLGLAVVDGFARALGLRVSAMNRNDQQGQGAIFKIIFPHELIVPANKLVT